MFSFYSLTSVSSLHLNLVYVPPEPIVDPAPTPPLPETSSPTSAPIEEIQEPCTNNFNICYALDMSGSVCNRNHNINCDSCYPSNKCRDEGYGQGTCCANFEKVREFAKIMTESLNGYGAFGASVVKFSTSASIESNMNTDIDTTLSALDGLAFSGGWTDHSDAIYTCQSTLPSTSDAKNIILLVTDGIPTKPDTDRNGNDAEDYAEMRASAAKNQGTVILPVFISSSNSEAQVNYMKRLSSDDNVFTTTSFDELNGLIESLTTTVLCDGSLQARNDEAETRMGVVVEIPVLDNDTGEGGLTINAITAQANYGTASYGGARIINYQPQNKYTGPDIFEYKMCDSTGACDTATVAVEILVSMIAWFD